ncbi:MAG: hypothetical protein IKO90_06885 [Bacteroidales bacterium]|nr:hypothetical protein [Bacteroidales bacterium]MBR4690172.1 hypothetical protein [Bacteroidales bacterium]MBR7035221.1 hypothetical protein [Bacteroidales bacterium]
MNKIIKLLILAGTIVLICSVSVYFYQTQVANTPSLAFSGNQFVCDVEKDIEAMASFDCENCTKDPEELYSKLADKFKIFEKYSLIDSVKYAELMGKFVAAYAGKFYESSVCKFTKPWNFSKENWRFERAAWLLDSANSKTFSPTIKANIASIQQVEVDYRSATKLLTQRGFGNMEESKHQVALSRKYKDDKYLSNCGSLAASLTAYPNQLHASHWAYVTETVEQIEFQIQVLQKLSSELSAPKKRGKYDMSKVLKGNYSRTYNDVAAKMPQMRKALDDYDTKAQATYGQKKDISDISKRVSAITQKFYSLSRPEN